MSAPVCKLALLVLAALAALALVCTFVLGGAMGAVLSLAGVLVATLICNALIDREVFNWLPTASAVVVVTATIILGVTLRHEEHWQLARNTDAEADHVQMLIKQRLKDRLQAVRRMSQRWATEGRPTREEWESDAANCVHDYPEMQSLHWIDSDFRVQWMVPHSEAEIPTSFASADDPTRRLVVDRTSETGQFTFHGTVEFPQGGKGIFGLSPITMPHGASDGMHVCVLRVNDLLDRVQEEDLANRFHIQVVEDAQTVYQSPGAAALPTFAAQRAVQFRGLAWTITTWPTADTIASQRSYLPEVVLALGSIIAALLASAVHFWQRARQRSLAAEQSACALRESEDRFQAAVRGSNDGLWDHNFATDRIYFSPAAKELMGYGADEEIDRIEAWSDRLHSDDRARVWSAVYAHLEKGAAYDVEYRLQVRPGEYRWLRGRGQVVRDEHGAPRRMAGTISDITDRKRVEQEVAEHTLALTETNRLLHESSLHIEQQAAALKQQAAELERAKQEAEEANAAKSMFIANMSHEIRTPMTAILGFVDLMLDEVAETHNQETSRWRQPLLTIKRNGEHLLTIINDILDLSKIESGRLEIEGLECSVRDQLEEVAALMQSRARLKGLSLRVACAPDVPGTIKTDPTRLRQIVLNLVGNAVKFTTSGHVLVTASMQSDASRRLQIDVADTGIGLTPEQLSSMFRPFVQADNTTSRKFGGTGLGLAISKRLAMLLGGDIVVESEMGKGSTFRITLAAEATATEGTRTASSTPVIAAATALRLTGRVLLAEDGLDNQRLVTLLLKKAGAEVVLAENGQQAIDLARAAWLQAPTPDGVLVPPIDLILMDVQMPIVDGLTATARLRAEGYSQPIIALTANVMPEDRESCLKAGCNDFATKPIERDQFFAIVGKWLSPVTGAPANLPVLS